MTDATKAVMNPAMQATVSTGQVHSGYWEDSQGNLVPVSKIKDIDKLRHEVVSELVQQAKELSAVLAQFKANTMGEVEAFIATSLEQYGVKVGGKKGNVTLTSFDGRFQVMRQMQDTLTFDERLQAAKALIDECVTEWSPGANEKIMALVAHAFQVDKEGKVSTGRVLGLRKLDIKDAKWLKAMEAIADSMHATGTKPYVRFYERNQDGKMVAIPVDLSGV